jgi:hypothetical protein
MCNTTFKLRGAPAPANNKVGTTNREVIMPKGQESVTVGAT